MNAPVAAKVKSQRSESRNSPCEVRIAYPYFHEKRTKNAAGTLFTKKDGTPNPRFGATFMFPKLDADPTRCANYAFLWGLAVEAAKKMWPQSVDNTGNWVWPDGAQYAVQDGDIPYSRKPKPGTPVLSPEEKAKRNAWRAGYWIVEAEHFLDPGPSIGRVVDGQVLPVLAKTINGVVQYKSGDWGFVNIHAYAYENETFGLNFGFDGFCFTREGEAIGSSGPRSAEQMFGGLAPGGVVAAPVAAPPPMPGAPVAPQAAMAPAAAPQPQAYAPPMPGAPTGAPVAPQAAPPPMPGAAAPSLPPMPGAAAPPLPPMPTR